VDGVLGEAAKQQCRREEPGRINAGDGTVSMRGIHIFPRCLVMGASEARSQAVSNACLYCRLRRAK